jgi:hypothetical protein
MPSLIEELQHKQQLLINFKKLTIKVLDYLPNVITNSFHSKGYNIFSSEAAGILKYTRPVNESLFLHDSNIFSENMRILLTYQRRNING